MRRVVVIADANVDRADPADAIGSTPSAEEVAVRCCRPTLKPGPEAIDSALVSAAVARAAASATRASARLRSRIPNTRGVDRSARAKFWLLAVQGAGSHRGGKLVSFYRRSSSRRRGIRAHVGTER